VEDSSEKTLLSRYLETDGSLLPYYSIGTLPFIHHTHHTYHLHHHQPLSTMRLGNKCLIWSFLAICIVFIGFQFVAWHKFANAVEEQNLNVPQPLVVVQAAASSSLISPPNTQQKDPKSSFRNTDKQVPAAQQQQEQQQQRQHLIFSTSCNYTQDWQSYLFFYQALKVNQPGDVTRIVSGCDHHQEEELQKKFDSSSGKMSDRFHIHFTPEFGKQMGEIYWEQTKYWNKPLGVKHWAKHVLGFPDSNEHDDDIIILMDPDMLLLKPFVNDFSSVPDELWTKSVRSQSGERITKVSQGHIIAQQHGFGSAWLEAASKNLTHVVGRDSPVHSISMEEANNLHPGGPPYVLTGRDMFRVTDQWAMLLPRLFDVSPTFMVEMYGYCLAAAHLKIPQQLAYGMMISDIQSEEEGFYFLKDVPPEALCDADARKSLLNVPHVLHFSHPYAIGEHFLSKHVIPDLITSCDTPVVKLPPKDIAFTNYSHYGDGSVEVWQDKKRKHQYRNAYMICTLMQALHDAALYYKKNQHCKRKSANLQGKWNFFDWKKGEEKGEETGKEEESSS
jgi:hypothetical protein